MGNQFQRGYVPVMCLKEPARKAVLELVKCGCQGNCDSANSSCLRNGLSCTALCKCTDCSNVQKLNLCEDIDEQTCEHSFNMMHDF